MLRIRVIARMVRNWGQDLGNLTVVELRKQFGLALKLNDTLGGGSNVDTKGPPFGARMVRNDYYRRTSLPIGSQKITLIGTGGSRPAPAEIARQRLTF